jgi:ATP-dependent Lhr-like helicase
MGGAAGFHPLLREYFARRFGKPTEIQEMVWPVASSGRHLLALAPTGSGKTLAAFYSFINDFVTGRLASGTTRLLYVSPLKALNNDIRRNLLLPLEELQSEFENAGLAMPEIRVVTRSGDTPQSERNRMRRHPPEILITTPESLNLLLASGTAGLMLNGLRAVIVDEIHAIAPGLRGAHLMTAIERLEEFAGPLQRIGLSATVADPDRIAQYLGGWQGEERRPVQLLYEKSPARAELDIKVIWNPAADGPLDTPAETVWDALGAEIYTKIKAGTRILCFTESRRVVERVAALVNDLHQKQAEEGTTVEPVAFAHHGSLSREIRLAVEEAFKAGRLRCVVATSSLELGIDIGELDEVLLLQCPSSVASAMQRLGRSGHRPGEVSRGTLYPLHSMDLVNGVVLRRLVEERRLEPIRPPSSPLDLLAQVLISMACEAEAAGHSLNVERAFELLRRSDTYHKLDRRHFDLTLEMLQGRFQGLPFSGLRASLNAAGSDSLLPVPGARLQLYQSGGTIPERGLYKLRMGGGERTLLGELDEEFVWERRAGDRFVLGSRLWQIQSIGDSEVEVIPATTGWGMSPFWRADSRDRENGFADAVADQLDLWNQEMQRPGFLDRLRSEEGDDVARELLLFLQRQREASHADLPGRYRIVAEVLPGEDDSYPVFLHTFWGGRRNRPFALALAAQLEGRYQTRIPYYASDDGVIVVLPAPPESEDVFSLPPELLDVHLEKALPESGLFGGQFRQSASTALLLPRKGFGRRTPLWLLRAAAGRLLEALSGKGEFPVTVEVYRALLRDRFDIDGLRARLDEWQSGQIEFVMRYVDQPTPFAAGIDFQRVNELTYEPDRVGGAGHRSSYFQELLGNRWIPVSRDSVNLFEMRSLRLQAGYAPDSEAALSSWLEERSFIPQSEWQSLRDLVRQSVAVQNFSEPAGGTSGPDAAGLSGSAAFEAYRFAGARESFVCYQGVSEILDRTSAGEGRDVPGAGDLLLRFLDWYGPVTLDRIRDLFGDLTERMLEEIDEQLIRAPLIKDDAADCLCLRRNLERIYRLQRHHTRLAPPLRPLRFLVLLVAHRQNVSVVFRKPPAQVEFLQQTMERLFGSTAPISLWEQQIFPARIEGYTTASLDALFTDSSLCFTGTGGESVFFFLEDEASLFLKQNDLNEKQRLQIAELSGGQSLFRAEASQREVLLQALQEGLVAGRSIAVLRKVARTSFRDSEEQRPQRRRWQSQADTWSVPGRAFDTDPLVVEEQSRLRVRLLLDRYGIIFRELLLKELPALRWSSVFRTLCRMELSGEVHAGAFFEGLTGLQFLSAEAYKWMQGLEAFLERRHVWWLNACDPASLCGLGLTVDDERPLPSRLPGNRMIYRGEKLAAVLTRQGRVIQFFDAPDEIDDLKQALLALLYVDFEPAARLTVEIINEQPSLQSPYRSALEAMGFQSDGKALVCHRERSF